MGKTTTATMNKLMRENNIPAIMYRGKGYYYFIVKGNHPFAIKSIYTYCISDWKPEEIMEEIAQNIVYFNS